MVHTFNCLGRDYALDVESGSIFKVDPLVKKIIDRRVSPGAFPPGDFSVFSTEDIAEAEAEVDTLISDGILFSKSEQSSSPQYTGVVKALCLNISHLCNLACTYCFADGGQYKGGAGNMPIEVAKAAVDFLIKKSGGRRNLEIDFFGGEPLLNLPVVRETVRYIRKVEKEHGKNITLTITTNAYKLTDEITDFFNEEMSNVVVSIDGRKHVHNSVRKTAGGGDSFDTILENALRFKSRRRGQYYIRGTYTANNLDFANDVLYLNDLGFDSLSIEPVVLAPSHPLALTKAHLPALIAEYERLAAVYQTRRKTNRNLLFFHFMLDVYNPPCREKLTRGCSAGCEYLAVSPDGSLYPCHQFDGVEAYKIGNVLDGSFDEAVPKCFSGVNVTTKAECANCWAKYYCGGGCNANAALLGGDIMRPDEVTCTLMKKRIECAIALSSEED